MLADPRFRPWRAEALKRGYASSIALPLMAEGQALGALTLYAREANGFQEAEVTLLTELTTDFAHGIMVLRTRAAKVQAEEDLRASEELNRRTLQALPAHIAVLDRNGRILNVNEAWTEFARNNAATELDRVAVGANYLEVCRRAAAEKDTDAAQALAGIEAVLAGTLEQFTLEYPCHSPRQPRWFLMTVAPFGVRGSGGAVIAHLNITTLKQAEAQMRIQARLLDAVGQVVVCTDLDQRITYWNQAAATLFGWTRDEALGQNLAGTHPAGTALRGRRRLHGPAPPG